MIDVDVQDEPEQVRPNNEAEEFKLYDNESFCLPLQLRIKDSSLGSEVYSPKFNSVDSDREIDGLNQVQSPRDGFLRGFAKQVMVAPPINPASAIDEVRSQRSETGGKNEKVYNSLGTQTDEVAKGGN